MFYRPAIFADDPGRGPDHSLTGVRGDPTLATAEKGRAMLAAMIDELVDGLTKLKGGHDERGGRLRRRRRRLRLRRRRRGDRGARCGRARPPRREGRDARRHLGLFRRRPARQRRMRTRPSPTSSRRTPARRPSPCCASSPRAWWRCPRRRHGFARRPARRSACAPRRQTIPSPATSSFGFAYVDALPGFDPASAFPAVRGSPAGARLFEVVRRNVALRPAHRGRARHGAERLVVENGAVRGVVAGGRTIAARRGVVLACGGFESDPALQAQVWSLKPVLSAAVRSQHRRRHPHGRRPRAPGSGTCGTITAPTVSGIPTRPIRSACA